MQYHVPFHLRHGASVQQPPVYIGFEVPPKRRRRFSWIGFFGFALCVMSFGVLAPFTLVMSLLGLRRGANFFSIAGTVLSGLALAAVSIPIMAGVAESHHRAEAKRRAAENVVYNQKVETTNQNMVALEKEIRQYKSENENQLPSPMAGNMLAVQHADAWGQEFRYETEDKGCVVRSAGGDRQFDTADDILRHIKGTVIDDHRIELEDEMFGEQSASATPGI